MVGQDGTEPGGNPRSSQGCCKTFPDTAYDRPLGHYAALARWSTEPPRPPNDLWGLTFLYISFAWMLRMDRCRWSLCTDYVELYRQCYWRQPYTSSICKPSQFVLGDIYNMDSPLFSFVSDTIRGLLYQHRIDRFNVVLWRRYQTDFKWLALKTCPKDRLECV